jgi:predicted nuclease of restriction endonuclease-like (RecB) superfamily
LSRNKEEVLKLSSERLVLENAKDILKSPLTLDFLGIEVKENYSENDLESAIIS